MRQSARRNHIRYFYIHNMWITCCAMLFCTFGHSFILIFCFYCAVYSVRALKTCLKSKTALRTPFPIVFNIPDWSMCCCARWYTPNTIEYKYFRLLWIRYASCVYKMMESRINENGEHNKREWTFDATTHGMEMIMDRKSKKNETKKKNNSKSVYTVEEQRKNTKNNKKWPVWFWSSKCKAVPMIACLNNALVNLCALRKTWFKQTHKHRVHASNLQVGVCCCLILKHFFSALLEISTRMRSNTHTEHATSNILNYRRSTPLSWIRTDEIVVYRYKMFCMQCTIWNDALYAVVLHAWNMSEK